MLFSIGKPIFPYQTALINTRGVCCGDFQFLTTLSVLIGQPTTAWRAVARPSSCTSINTRKRYPCFLPLPVITALRLLPLATRGESFDLPRTGIPVGYAKALLIRPNGNREARGVVPDIRIATPVVLKHDVVLERALAAIHARES